MATADACAFAGANASMIATAVAATVGVRMLLSWASTKASRARRACGGRLLCPKEARTSCFCPPLPKGSEPCDAADAEPTWGCNIIGACSFRGCVPVASARSRPLPIAGRNGTASLQDITNAAPDMPTRDNIGLRTGSTLSCACRSVAASVRDTRHARCWPGWWRLARASSELRAVLAGGV